MTPAISSFAGAAAAQPTIAERRADKASKDFESVFISQMIEPLLSSVKTPDIAGGGESEDYFKSLMRDAYAKAIAERGGFGIAARVKATLLELQAAKSAPSSSGETN